MNNARTTALVGAAVLTAVTVIAYLDHWTTLAPILRTATVGGWIIYSIAAGTELILGAITGLREDITGLREDITTYGELQRSDGVIDGIRHNTPAQPTTLTRVR